MTGACHRPGVKRLAVLVALVGCATSEPISSRMVPTRRLEFSSRPIGTRPFEHDATVTAVAFASSGDRLVTGTVTGQVSVFGLDGRLRERTRVFDGGVVKLALLDDGRVV